MRAPIRQRRRQLPRALAEPAGFGVKVVVPPARARIRQPELISGCGCIGRRYSNYGVGGDR